VPEFYYAMTKTDDFKVLFAQLQQRLESLASSFDGIAGIYIEDLENGESIGINPDLAFPQASAIKIPILIDLFRQADAGKIVLSERVTMSDETATGGSGVLQKMAAGHSAISWRDLGMLMIVISDNTATNLLIDRLGIDSVNQMLNELGCKTTRLNRRMMDTDALAQGRDNLSTPAEGALIINALREQKILGTDSCQQVLDILKMDKVGYLKAGIKKPRPPFASKPGKTPGITTEWGLVELPGSPYLISVMVKLEADEELGKGFLKEVSQLTWSYFSRKANATNFGTYLAGEYWTSH
jgi:beta-lactamase class A